MALDTRLTALAQAVGAKIKALSARWSGPNPERAVFGTSGLSQNRLYLLPDKSGVLALYSDLAEFPSGDTWIYGDASDFSVILDGTQIYSWASRSGSSGAWVYTLTRDVYADELVVPAGTRLSTANYRIFCQKLSGSGVISNSGASSPNGSMTATTVPPAGTLPAAQGGTAGVAGAASANTASQANCVAGAGGRGGAGGGFSTGTVGAANLPNAAAGGLGILKQLQNALEARIQASLTRLTLGGGGSGGTGGAGTQPTAGGAGAGMILIAAKVWNFQGSVEAIGGSSGSASSGICGTGGSGGGGCIVLVTSAMYIAGSVSDLTDYYGDLYSPLSGGSGTFNVSSGSVGFPTGGAAMGARGRRGNLQIIQTQGS